MDILENDNKSKEVAFDKQTNKGRSKKSKALRFVRNISIGAFILLALLIIAGVVYTWYMGQTDIENTAADAKPPKVNQPAKVATPQINPNARVGVAVQMFTTPIKPGSNATMSVKTNPKAICSITAVYNKVPSKDSGLVNKTADDYGIVSWTWTVENSVPAGKWPVTVTCKNSKYSGVYIGDLVVTK